MKSNFLGLSPNVARTNEIVRVFPTTVKFYFITWVHENFEWLWHKMLLGYTSGKLECRLAHARSLTRFRRPCFLVRGRDLGTRLVSIANLVHIYTKLVHSSY